MCESASSSEVDQLSARIAEREGQLSGLNKELQQRRTTIPTWMGQRLEQHSSTVCDAPRMRVRRTRLEDDGVGADDGGADALLERQLQRLRRAADVTSV